MSRRPTPRAAPARVALVRCCPHDGQVRIASVTSPRGGVRPAARSTPPRSPRRWPDSGRTSWQSRRPTPGGPARTTSPARTTPINVTCRVAPWRRWTGDGLRRWRARPAPHTRGARCEPMALRDPSADGRAHAMASRCSRGSRPGGGTFWVRDRAASGPSHSSDRPARRRTGRMCTRLGQPANLVIRPEPFPPRPVRPSDQRSPIGRPTCCGTAGNRRRPAIRHRSTGRRAPATPSPSRDRQVGAPASECGRYGTQPTITTGQR